MRVKSVFSVDDEPDLMGLLLLSERRSGLASSSPLPAAEESWQIGQMSLLRANSLRLLGHANIRNPPSCKSRERERHHPTT